jgi:hypothetical protein
MSRKMARAPSVDLLRLKDLLAIFLQSEAKDLSSCLFSTVYEQLQGCFAKFTLSEQTADPSLRVTAKGSA